MDQPVLASTGVGEQVAYGLITDPFTAFGVAGKTTVRVAGSLHSSRTEGSLPSVGRLYRAARLASGESRPAAAG